MKNLLKSTLLFAIMLIAVSCFKSNNAYRYPYEATYLPVMLEGAQKWSIIDVNSGEVVAKDAFVNMPSPVIADIFFVANENGTFDYYNISDLKKPINKEHYGSVTEFSEDGFAIASKQGGNLCVIDAQCNQVADLGDSIIEATMFNNGLSVVQSTDGKYGYVNTKGEVVIAPQYDQAFPFLNSDMAVVGQVKDTAFVDFSFIDKTGKATFSSNSTVYQPDQTFQGKIIKAGKRDTIVCLNAQGQEVDDPSPVPDVIKKTYQNGGIEGAGNYIVVQNGKMGVVDNSGKQILPIKYLTIIDLSPTRFLISEQEGVFYIADKTGKPVGKTKIAHANGTPGATAQIGKVEPANVCAVLMSSISDQGFAGIPKDATVSTFYGTLDGVHPESYTGKDAIVAGGAIIQFAGPIVTETSPKNYTFNLNTPVKAVTVDQDLSIYATDTEQKVIELMAINMGKVGFSLQGDNVFVSDKGTAIAIGYKNGHLGMIYFMNAADAKPLPCIARKPAK